MNADAGADTFAKLLLRNAAAFADRPAMRHKSYGIWQSWTWAASRAAIASRCAAPTGRGSTGR
jgi:long-chain acyl-CoA synthetase